MSKRLVEGTARLLESRTSRRGFLRRAAVVGSALVAAPAAYVLRPGSAYSAVTRTPSNCPSGSRCRDGGWTEFCCTMTGVNTCPPGSMIAGWWRAEYPGSGTDHCDGNSRYYMDCNSSDCHGCGCGGSGTCGNECVDCNCTCANDDCSNWKTCCTRFRYGQCNQNIACLGPIVCRVVTCVAPWEWDSTCTTTDAVSQSTWYHDAACLHPSSVYAARPGVITGNTWKLRDTLTSGVPQSTYDYGQQGDVHLMADWTGAGIRTSAVVRGTRRGPAGDTALTWYVRQVEGEGRPDLVFEFGQAGDIPVVGDWNGDGVATPGVVRGNRWLLRNSNSTGPADMDFDFGQPGDSPVVGRWTDDGRARPGVVRGTTWMLRTTDGGATASFEFGPGGVPVVGDWAGTGVDRPGWFADGGTWYLRNSLTPGAADETFQYGASGDVPVVWGRIS
ncbi:MAG TPA: twin-arginine translocation signal domain-containing protein [Acidimicrobiia bacterium]|nr:twin-arginine translocation signal domain-containing protein [Acidimicrobiia bacterium]